MEDCLKRGLDVTFLKQFGPEGSGCINRGQAYDTDHGKIYVKFNKEPWASCMYGGESASLEAIRATNTVDVPTPIKVLENPEGGAMLVTTYLDMKELDVYAGELGEEIARMHLHNEDVAKKAAKQVNRVHKDNIPEYVSKFGFHRETYCGVIPQDNTWRDDWTTFYIRQRLQQQMDLLEKDYRDEEAKTLWAQLLPKVPGFFNGLKIVPSLLHGDLHCENAAELSDRRTIFDPFVLYGHHEFEIALAMMFDSFPQPFFDRYYSIIPKTPGYSARIDVYQLFHNVNHWNHMGGTRFREPSIQIMKRLLKATD